MSNNNDLYEYAGRNNHPEDTVVEITSDIKIGGGNFSIIAGPCAVESEFQACTIAAEVKKAGATLYRGGAFKPRTSPHSFQGLREEGIKLLEKAKKISDLPLVSEIMDISQIPLFENIDVTQVGARNMQNFELLKRLGQIDKPVLLKRGMSNTIHELLLSAEYILSGGNNKVILCERGIRTFETSTKNTLDLSALPVLKSLTHLPVIVDPSHATGTSSLVKPMAMASTIVGADGLMIEVHNDPDIALCDGKQALNIKEFTDLASTVNELKPLSYKCSYESSGSPYKESNFG